MAITGVRKPLPSDYFSGAYSPVGIVGNSDSPAFDPYSPSRSGSDSDHMVPNSITASNPTTPGESNFGSSAKDAYAPSLGITTQKPDIIRDVYGPQLADVGSKLESAYSAPRPGMARQILGAIISRKNPALGGFVSGEIQRQRSIEPLTQEYGILQNQIGAIRAQQNQEVKNRLDLSTAGKNEAETAAIPQKTAAEVARDSAATEASYYKEDPNMGLIDIRTKQPVAGNNAAPLTKEEADYLGKQEGERVPLKVKNLASEGVNRGYTTVNTEQGVFEHRHGAPASQMTRLGDNPREIMLDMPTGAVDNTTGKQVMVTKKDIVSNPGRYAPISSDIQTPAAKATLISATSGKMGNELAAFDTALKHADLLKQAYKALNNGDVRTLNGLDNSFKSEFGSGAPRTFDALANLYTGETTKVVTGGHITDSELGKTGATLSRNASPSEFEGVMNAYEKAMRSKREITMNRIQSGLKGQVATGEEAAAPAASPAATHRFNPATGQIEAIQ